ncbi:calcium-binding protein [Neisseria wadsworthii]|uniref:calcium-binding protein n=1 Tax=Neisseria wadsworthii TaxID=607711 RepID=UPI00131DD67F|nr:calcium-binding protein [Neisseria wadsworthii]
MSYYPYYSGSSFVRYARDSADYHGGFSNKNTTTGTNDSYDAYRHALLSAKLTKYLGEDKAKYYLDKHEKDVPNHPRETNMDKWNNDVGRREYYNWKQAKEKNETSDSLEKWIYDAVKKGRTINDLDDERKWVEREDRHWCTHEDWKEWQDANRDGKFHWIKPDPLTLDLDGDGIETVRANGYQGALFDHNKDGIKTATGWISADDGILVVDKNLDGIINNGDELFGDNYTLKNGSTAPTGYAALEEFDSNGDKIIDAKDENFDKLRIWRDLNQDGTSQKEELFTLQELNVQSLNVAYNDVNQNLGNGNSLAREGSYTTLDGKTRKMGDLLLANDNLFSRYTDSVPMTEEQAKTPNLQGISRLPDLREAAALSPDLAANLKAYSEAETKEAQKALLDGLIDKWAKTDPLYGSGIQFLPLGIETQNEGATLSRGQAEAAKILIPSQEYLDMVDSTLQKIAALDAFSGLKSNTVYVTSNQDILRFYQTTVKTYGQLSDNIYQGLLFQTRLKPYLEEIGFTIENNEFKLDYSKVLAKFNEVHAKDPQKALVDLGEFIIHGKHGDNLDKLSELFTEYVYQASEIGVLGAYAEALGKDFWDFQKGTEKNDSLNNSGEKKLINYLGGRDGNDVLNGGDRKDVLEGNSGDDELHGRGGDDRLVGGTGNDKLYGSYGADKLIGGTGDDYLEGGRGADIYEFAKGHGHDVIYEDDGYSIDTIRLNNITFAETKFAAKESSLILSGYHDGDSITIKDFFRSDKHQIETFQFDDRLVTLEELSQEGIKLEGTDGDDSMSMYHWYDTAFSYQTSVYAGAGNDFVSTADAADFLDGGAGDDTLHGNGGDDTLVGGAGNDYLEGGNGADTYVFEKGHGKDVVCGKPDGDLIQLNDVTLQEVRFSKNDKDLILFGYNEDDSITLKDFFVNMSYEIERFKFKDQEVVFFDLIRSYEGVKLEGTDGNDSISFSPTRWLGKGIVDAGDGDDTVTGTITADILEGGAGNDKLYGKLSADKLIGGTGNDYLEGGNGADTYVFAKGHGHDVIYEGKADKSKDEIILTDINLDETQYCKDGNDLILFGYNQGDSITVKDFFSDINHQIELFEFKDESVFAPEFDKYLSTENNMTNSMSVFSFKYDEEKTSLESVIG